MNLKAKKDAFTRTFQGLSCTEAYIRYTIAFLGLRGERDVFSRYYPWNSLIFIFSVQPFPSYKPSK